MNTKQQLWGGETFSHEEFGQVSRDGIIVLCHVRSLQQITRCHTHILHSSAVDSPDTQTLPTIHIPPNPPSRAICFNLGNKMNVPSSHNWLAATPFTGQAETSRGSLPLRLPPSSPALLWWSPIEALNNCGQLWLSSKFWRDRDKRDWSGCYMQ